MKKLLLLIFIFTSFKINGQTTNSTPYCPYHFDGGSVQQTHYISSVTLDTFTNNTGTVQQPTPHYIYYNNLPAINIVLGAQYNFSVNVDTLGAERRIYIFIDWDRNGSFTGLEYYGTSIPLTGSDSVFSVVVQSPGFAIAGPTRMRVTVNEDGSGTLIGFPCSTMIDWGEAEDYDVNLIAASGIEVNKPVSVLLYPTIVESSLTIQSEEEIESLNIYNSAGQKVFYSKYKNEKEVTLNLSDLPSGIYKVLIQCRNGIATKSFIKK
ncbi:MAG: GEVED domain-containing protein [Bacteroidota bacterium]